MKPKNEAYNIPRIGRSGSSIKQKPTTEEQTYGFCGENITIQAHSHYNCFRKRRLYYRKNRKASTRRKANDWSGLPIWWRNIRLPIYSPKRLGHMGKQQTAGQIKGEWHSRRKEVVSAWPKLRKQTGYASLLCLPHFWISHNHIK